MGFGIGPQLFIPVAQHPERHSSLAVLCFGFGCHWGLNADPRRLVRSHFATTRP